MLITTQVQYLHSQQFESINCDDLDVQDLWSYIIHVSNIINWGMPGVVWL